MHGRMSSSIIVTKIVSSLCSMMMTINKEMVEKLIYIF